MANRIGIDVVIGTLFHGRALGKAQSEILGFAAKTSAALAGVGIVSGKLATDFEKGFAQVNTIVGLTGKEFDKLRAGALAVAADSSFAIGDLNKALFDLVSAGVPATNAIDALRLSSEAATAGAASLSDAVNAGISVVNAFGLEASDLSDVFDVQFATVKRGVTTFQELAAFQGQLIPQATALGVSFKEMFGALGFLTTQGQRTRIAVSGLGNAFVSMAQQEEKLRKEGIRLFDAQTGQFRGLVPVVADFQRRLEGLSDAQKSAFFADVNLSQEAQRAIVPMINQFLRFRDTVTDVADESGGAMEDAFTIMANTADEKLGRMLNSFKVVGIALGETLLPQLKGAAEGATKFANSLAGLDESTKKVASLSAEVFIAGTAFVTFSNLAVASMAKIKVAVVGVRGAVAALAGVAALPELAALAAAFAGLKGFDKLVESGKLTESTFRRGGFQSRTGLLAQQSTQLPPAVPVSMSGFARVTDETVDSARKVNDAWNEVARSTGEAETPLNNLATAAAQAAQAVQQGPLAREDVSAFLDSVAMDLHEAVREPQMRELLPPTAEPFTRRIEPAPPPGGEFARFALGQMGLTEEQSIAAARQLEAENTRALNEEVRQLIEAREEELIAAGLLEAPLKKATKESQALSSAISTIGDVFEAGFAAMLTGAQSFTGAMQSMANELLAMAARLAARKLFSFFTLGFFGLQHGGLIRGGTPGVDSVPIMAQQGEVVVPKPLAGGLIDFFRGLGTPGSGRFAGGGLVAAGGLGSSMELTVNVTTPDVDGMRRFVQSDEFVSAMNEASRQGLIR